MNQVNSNIIKHLSEFINEENISSEMITPKKLFLVCLVVLLFGVIYADTSLEEKEKASVNDILQKIIGNDDNTSQFTLKIFNKAKQCVDSNPNYFTVQTYLLEILSLPFFEHEKLLLLSLGCKVAAADGAINDSEKNYLEKIAKDRLKIDWERHLPVLEAAYISQIKVQELAIYEVEKKLNPQKFAEFGNSFFQAADDIHCLISKLKPNEQEAFQIELPVILPSKTEPKKLKHLKKKVWSVIKKIG